MTTPVLDFLSDTKWVNAHIDWRKADWSPRDFARLSIDGETAILLQSPPDDSPDTMIGHQIGTWVDVNTHFHALGLNVPNIYKQDVSAGLILMQDFGDDTIANKGIDGYLQATDILIQMRDHEKSLAYNFIRYEDTHVYQALRFYPQYVLHNESLTDQWFNAWTEVENALPPCPRALTHIDYHPGNLMWTDNIIGIIDFQAACNGPFVYDMVNLLEDIRRDVPTDIKQACIKKYCEGLSVEDKAVFDAWYPVICVQFFARILGQIQFLSDEKGRDDLKQYYGSTEKRLEKLLHLPELRPILQVIKGS